MKRKLCLAALAAIILVGSDNVTRAGDLRFDGDVYGVELCPQFVCGAAVFAGIYEGRIGWWRYTYATFEVEVEHEDLPAPYEFSGVTGGSWRMNSFLRRIRGDVCVGSIYNNGDNTFTVTALLELTRGGSGYVMVEIVLDHRVFPPLVYGVMYN